jgi:hypothetical protein
LSREDTQSRVIVQGNTRPKATFSQSDETYEAELAEPVEEPPRSTNEGTQTVVRRKMYFVGHRRK